MKRKELEERIDILYDLMFMCHGSGIDAKWLFIVKDAAGGSYTLANSDNALHHCQEKIAMVRSKAITLMNSFHCMNEHGYYCGWADFSVIFPNNKPLDEYRIVFHGADSQRLNKRHDIRDYIDQCIIGAIHDIQEKRAKVANNPGDNSGSLQGGEAQA